MCTELSQNDLEDLTVKSTLHTVTTYPEAQILPSFALRPPIFKNGTFHNSPLTPTLNRQKKNKLNNLPKNPKF